MAPGESLVANAGVTTLASTYNITRAMANSDTGTFSLGANDASQAACWYNGINPANWTVVGLAGSACTNASPPHNAYTVTVNVISGVVQAAPTQYGVIPIQKIVQGTDMLVTDNTTVAVDTTIVAQKFIGSGAPTAVPGSLSGDQYFDSASSYAQYKCAATSCASGSNWLAVGGGASTTAPTVAGVFNSTGSSAQVAYSFPITAGAWISTHQSAHLVISYTPGAMGGGIALDIQLNSANSTSGGTSISGNRANTAANIPYTYICDIGSLAANSQVATCTRIADDIANSTGNGQAITQATASITSSATMYVNVVVTGNGNSGDFAGKLAIFTPAGW